MSTPGDRPVCSIEGCDRPVGTRGWCQRHYHRWVRTGNAHRVEDLHADTVVTSLDELAEALTRPATFATHNPFTITWR